MNDRVEFETAGRLWRRKLLSTAEVDALTLHCDVGDRPGVRLDLTSELLAHLGPISTVGRDVTKLGVDAAPVRLVTFNKSVDTNWGVPWHQDRVIAVAQRSDVQGYSNWISKAGFWHCQPPGELLAKMIFIRVHIDHCDEGNGAMEVALGSHNHGLVPTSMVRTVAAASVTELCEADPGDVLILKALTIHRSRRAAQRGSRRAVRVDYARRDDLDRQLEWSLAG